MQVNSKKIISKHQTLKLIKDGARMLVHALEEPQDWTLDEKIEVANVLIDALKKRQKDLNR